MAVAQVRWIASGVPGNDAVLAYAGRELGRYVTAMTGAACPVRRARRTGAGETIWIGLADQMEPPAGANLESAEWDDGYVIWSLGGALYIAGANPRSVLFGVYGFLEGQGVRFVRPGRLGEVVPRLERLELPEAPVVERPGYRHRGLCIEGAPSLRHALDMVDWAAKKRMNTLFLQFFSSRYFYNLWYERPYNPRQGGKPVTDAEALAMDDRVIAEAKRRGMVFHRVGHSWTSAAWDMPRSGWVKAHEAEVDPALRRYIAEVDGERKLFGGVPINTELCYSHEPAFNRFVENIVGYSEAHPEMDVVHVWLSDATNNKCECDDCRKLNISDWYAKVINRLSEALHERAPHTRFVFLCYFELLWPPEQVKVDDRYGNAIMMFAPISRCYGHALADPTCDDGQPWPRPALNQFAVSRQNAFFVRTLADWRRAFGGDSFDFDYHLMWAIWRQMTDTQLARVLHQDLKDLKRLGLDGLVSCQSFRNFYPSGLAMTAMTESLWDPKLTWEEVRERYLEAAYGENAAFASQYLLRTEEYLNTGDDHWRTPPFSTADATKLEAADAFLASSLRELVARRGETSDVRNRSLDILAHHAQLLRHIVHAYQSRLSGDTAAANRHLDRAREFLQKSEPRFSAVIDTYLALTNSVEAHRPL